MLFNLATDPTESHDLSRSPAHTSRFESMSAALAKWAESIAVSQVRARIDISYQEHHM